MHSRDSLQNMVDCIAYQVMDTCFLQKIIYKHFTIHSSLLCIRCFSSIFFFLHQKLQKKIDRLLFFSFLATQQKKIDVTLNATICIVFFIAIYRFHKTIFFSLDAFVALNYNNERFREYLEKFQHCSMYANTVIPVYNE